MRLSVLLFLISAAMAQTVVKYHATINDVKYLYGPAAPVAHVKAGDIIETNTLDAFGNVLKKPGDKQSMVKGDNPLTGPFYVEGAQPGDTLTVKFLSGVRAGVRGAERDGVDWIHKDYGLSSLDAYELLSKVAKIHLDEMVDPNYVVVASIDKKFLPVRKK